MTTSLSGQNAINLFKKGKDIWNEWVKKNPNANVSFANMDLSNCRNSEGIIDFSDFHFPNGRISFSRLNLVKVMSLLNELNLMKVVFPSMAQSLVMVISTLMALNSAKVRFLLWH